MAGLEQTQFHKVFLAEVEGRTLVVTPRGDSIGFRDTDVAGELKTLLSLIGTPGIVNLVVDLGNAEYFGSTMIGAINQLGTRFREIGGKIALCNPLAADVRHARHHAPGRSVDEVRHAEDRPALHEQDLSRDILLTTLNARYAHAAFGLRYLLANMGDLAPRTELLEFVASTPTDQILESLLARDPKILGPGRLYLERRRGHAAGARAEAAPARTDHRARRTGSQLRDRRAGDRASSPTTSSPGKPTWRSPPCAAKSSRGQSLRAQSHRGGVAGCSIG